jgi:DNA-binding NarL/FixJ family response regulator
MGDGLFRDLHFLIADDEPLILLELDDMLKSMGATHITRATCGDQALAKLGAAQRRVDCVLCDLNMPDGNGLQVLKAIRTGKIASLRLDLCFIMVTAIADRHLIEAAIALDANGYLVKPIAWEKLRNAVIKGRARHFVVEPTRYAMVAVPQSSLFAPPSHL